MPGASQSAPERFDALQSMRGLLACAVVAYHMTAQTHFYAFVHGSYAAVDFFFVLSGFVIASAYGERMRSGGAFVQYVVRRIGRLYPLHLFVLGIWLALEFSKQASGASAFTGATSWPSLWSSLALTQAFGPDAITWNYPSWSISIELWANLAAGLVIVALGRRWRLGAAAMIALLAGFYFSQHVIDYGAFQKRFNILANDAEYAAGFFLGMLTHAAWRGLARLGLRAFWGLDVLAIVATLAVFRHADDMPAFSKSAIFAVVVLILAFERGPICALLRRPASLWLGTVSYSIYLTHVLLVNAATSAIYRLGDALHQPTSAQVYGEDTITLLGPWFADAAVLGVIAATTAVSGLTYRLVEDPARRWFNRISRQLA
jgi:peptidoglycan/LPS O-acetylase OafA/YrhL